MIRHIIFDIGNVLAAFQWEKRFKSFCGSPEELERLAGATVHSEMWKELDKGVLSERTLMEGFVRNDPELESLIRSVLSSYSGMIGLYDYTISWIKELKERTGHVVVASSSHKGNDYSVIVNKLIELGKPKMLKLMQKWRTK